MTASHVFVVQSDLTKLACDVVLAPTDVGRDRVSTWLPLGEMPAAPPGWANEDVRVTDAVRLADGRLVRWVNTGSVPSEAKVDWLKDGVVQALALAQSDAAGPPARYRRARPLIAMPIFGSGAGGFDKIRGRVLQMLLDVAETSTQQGSADVALVCYDRADYAAVQQERAAKDHGTNKTHAVLHASLQKAADELGERARNGSLALFMGAGVSIPAGLPSWGSLIDELCRVSSRYADRAAELRSLPAPDAAGLLIDDLIDGAFERQLRSLLERTEHALPHALLASLRVPEAITTNFDKLYEDAAAVTFGQDVLKVLPWHRSETGRPWLLKLHGDYDKGAVTLSRDDFLAYDARWRPLASILQATLMSRHVLFVGYSLTDENFVRLARDVRSLIKRINMEGGQVGSVVSLTDLGARKDVWEHDLQPIEISDLPADAPDLAEPARHLEIFLDRLAMSAAEAEHSYLLDPRYVGLEVAEAQADAKLIGHLVDDVVPLLKASSPERWTELRSALISLGAKL